jgi:ADP-ribose pyrophosphatase
MSTFQTIIDFDLTILLNHNVSRHSFMLLRPIFLSSRQLTPFFRPIPFNKPAIRTLKMTTKPHITRTEDLQTTDSRWVALKKLTYIDPKGNSRTWEVATRKTRAAQAGIDAVAIGPLIHRPNQPLSTVLVLQYRPPVDAITVEWPAGLIDEGESVEEAAVRELREETGYEGKVLGISPTIAADPGMSSANMQLVMVECKIQEGDEEPVQQLDEGENIELVMVPVEGLYAKLEEYSKREGYMVAAKLWHWAAGVEFATKLLPGMKEGK